MTDATRKTLKLTWKLGRHRRVESAPEMWVDARVPGAVQLDWAAAHDWPPLHVGENWRQYDGLEDDFWTYRTRLPESLPDNRAIIFVCHGVDYSCDVLLDGEVVYRQEGMFTPIRLDLTGRARGGDELRVRVHPAPKAHGPADRVQARQSCKPAVSYKWDFHPRLIPLGIWDEAYLELCPRQHLSAARVTYRLNDTLDRASLRCEVDATACPDGTRVQLTLLDPDGAEASRAEEVVRDGAATLASTVGRPKLWWPHDQGPSRCTRGR